MVDTDCYEPEPHGRFENTAPYSVLNRKERSRELAQKRRTTYKSLMRDLAEELPFSKDVVSQIDYNSRLRLALCFFRMKSLTRKKTDSLEEKEKALESYEENKSPFVPGMLQELMVESLDGFLLVTLGDGSIIFLSESIHKHLGLFQSEHIGFPLFDLIHDDDQSDVRRALREAEIKVVTQNLVSTECSFFCRIKCSRFKVSNTAAKSPGYKLVFISGHFKVSGREPFFVAIVRPVSPPSILEIRMEGNMYVAHYTLDFRCCFYDGRLNHLIGYDKNDLLGHVPFEFHHHDDVYATLDCAKGLMSRGEGLSAYYRFQNKFGEYIWMQSRATMMFDSRTGRPSYIVCMNFVINKEEGDHYLHTRKAIKPADANTSDSERSHDPFPVPRGDNNQANPFAEFMAMMAKNMGGMDGMDGMAGLMSSMGEKMRMPSPNQADEPSSTTISDVPRSSSVSPDSGLSSCSFSPSEATPDSTTKLCGYPSVDSVESSGQRYSESSCSQFDEGYHSGTGRKSLSMSFSASSSPLMMDSFSPASDIFLPIEQPATTQAQTYVKEERLSISSASNMQLQGMTPPYDQSCQYTNPSSRQASTYNPHCRYSSGHMTATHIKQEPSQNMCYTIPPHSQKSSASQFVDTRLAPITVTAESFPATLPILNNEDLQILDLARPLTHHPHSRPVLTSKPFVH